MARIKAKPMNRLPITSVQIPNKPGFAPTPPPPVFDPNAAAFAAAQPRFTYATNGATLSQGTVAYGGQVHMIVSVSEILIYYSDQSDAGNAFVLCQYTEKVHKINVQYTTFHL